MESRTPAEAHARSTTLRRLARAARGRALAGRRFRCLACGRGFRSFLAGPGGRANAACPRCGSLERHRALVRVLDAELPAQGSLRVLHFAPDGVIRHHLRRPGFSYTGADLHPEPGDLEVDIQAMPFDAASFDVIVCSHVLEHVPDDRLAMRELRRVLADGGTAFLQHPIDFDLAATIEDPDESDPAERTRRFGQDDHVRKYGLDIAERLTEAGFAVAVRSTRDLTAEERDRLRLEEPWEPHATGSDVYVCS